MRLIIGLGNPGEKYAHTRHNIAWRVLDEFRATWGFPVFKTESKFRAALSIADVNGEKIILMKPEAFMNLSGEAVRAVLDFYKLTPADIHVISDDKDLPFGELRLRKTGGHGGHNGLRNIIQHLGTQDFIRLKIGIANEYTELTPTDQFVLARFSAEEEKQLPDVITQAVEILKTSCQENINIAE